MQISVLATNESVEDIAFLREQIARHMKMSPEQLTFSFVSTRNMAFAKRVEISRAAIENGNVLVLLVSNAAILRHPKFGDLQLMNTRDVFILGKNRVDHTLTLVSRGRETRLWPPKSPVAQHTVARTTVLGKKSQGRQAMRLPYRDD